MAVGVTLSLCIKESKYNICPRQFFWIILPYVNPYQPWSFPPIIHKRSVGTVKAGIFIDIYQTL